MTALRSGSIWSVASQHGQRTSTRSRFPLAIPQIVAGWGKRRPAESQGQVLALVLLEADLTWAVVQAFYANHLRCRRFCRPGNGFAHRLDFSRGNDLLLAGC